MNTPALIDRGACPLCGGTDARTHIAFPDIPVARCSGCDFMYSSRVLDARGLSAYYENDFGSDRHRRGQIVNAQTNFAVVSGLLDLSAVHTALDVGTGYGYLLSELRRRRPGIEAVGVELSRQEAEYATARLGERVINLPLAESGLRRGYYDLVTAFEVIEHVSNPVRFIREMAEFVRPGGWLLIMTDNFEGSVAKSLGPAFPKWIPHAHISHFSYPTLKRAIEQTPDLTVSVARSYTPWEIVVRDRYYRLRGVRKTPEQAFCLASTLSSEMGGDYPLFRLRKFANQHWARLSLSEAMDGDLMFVVARKAG